MSEVIKSEISGKDEKERHFANRKMRVRERDWKDSRSTIKHIYFMVKNMMTIENNIKFER